MSPSQMWEIYRLLLRRQVEAKYRGTMFGRAWAFIQPLLMLAAFAFVFGNIIPVKWGEGPGQAGTVAFVVNMFCGLVVYYYFAEVVSQASVCVAQRPNFVKKIVFPLALLPLVEVGAASVNFLFGLINLLLVVGIWQQGLSLEVLLIPLMLLPYLVFLAALALVLAAVGVFFKDLPQVVAPLVQLMMFLSPVFYPLKSLPAGMQEWAYVNPLVPMIEGLRAVVAGGYTVDWGYLGGALLLSAAFLWVALRWFNRVRGYFADSI